MANSKNDALRQEGVKALEPRPQVKPVEKVKGEEVRLPKIVDSGDLTDSLGDLYERTRMLIRNHVDDLASDELVALAGMRRKLDQILDRRKG